MWYFVVVNWHQEHVQKYKIIVSWFGAIILYYIVKNQTLICKWKWYLYVIETDTLFNIVIQYVNHNFNVMTNFINYDSIQRNTLTFLKYGKEHKFVEWKCSQMCFTQLHIGSYFDCRMSNHVLLLAVHINNHRTSTTEFWTNLHCFFVLSGVCIAVD